MLLIFLEKVQTLYNNTGFNVKINYITKLCNILDVTPFEVRLLEQEWFSIKLKCFHKTINVEIN